MPSPEPTHVHRSVVQHFVRGLGFDPAEVREVLIEPTEIEVELYERDDDGRITLRVADNEPVTRVVSLAVA